MVPEGVEPCVSRVKTEFISRYKTGPKTKTPRSLWDLGVFALLEEKHEPLGHSLFLAFIGIHDWFLKCNSCRLIH